MIVGADGCKAGWLVLTEHEGGIASTVVPTLAPILDLPNLTVLAVDIPIGIPLAGSRAADTEARRLLKTRGSCVFPTPVRSTLDAETYPEACALHLEADGRKLSKQAFAILPKIKEVDDLLRHHPNANRVYEIHPEISFAAMNELAPLTNSKHTLLGLNDRLNLITREFGPGTFESIRRVHKAKEAKDDDILDALAALWTARRIAAHTAQRLPTHACNDPHGLPMHINC